MTTFEALMKIAALLAKGKVKESLEYYNEPTESAPPLSECVHYLEKLLSSLPEDIKVKYSFELNGIKNEIADLKDGKYYERLHSRGVPLISTIGGRLQDRITRLEIAVLNNEPGMLEKIKEPST